MGHNEKDELANEGESVRTRVRTFNANTQEAETGRLQGTLTS